MNTTMTYQVLDNSAALYITICHAFHNEPMTGALEVLLYLQHTIRVLKLRDDKGG